MSSSKNICKGTTKNPNEQIKLVLICHLQDFTNVASGELRKQGGVPKILLFFDMRKYSDKIFIFCPAKTYK